MEDDEEEGTEGIEHFDEEVPPQTDIGGKIWQEESINQDNSNTCTKQDIRGAGSRGLKGVGATGRDT